MISCFLGSLSQGSCLGDTTDTWWPSMKLQTQRLEVSGRSFLRWLARKRSYIPSSNNPISPNPKFLSLKWPLTTTFSNSISLSQLLKHKANPVISFFRVTLPLSLKATIPKGLKCHHGKKQELSGTWVSQENPLPPREEALSDG